MSFSTAVKSDDAPADASFAVDHRGLIKILGFTPHNATLIAWERAGTFPRRFKLPGSPRSLWVRQEVLDYLRGAAANRGKMALVRREAASASPVAAEVAP